MIRHRRYQSLDVLGRGAQGVVFRVRDREAPDRALCAKLWQPGCFSDELLRGEFALLCRARIAGLVRAHDLGRDEASGAPFLVEDFVDGPDARAFVLAAPPGRERARRLARLGTDVAATLALLHDAGFVHGDLKPAHVRVPASGHAVLLDLGSAASRARVSARPGEPAPVLALTRAFAAPELLAGAAASPAADLYSLGATLWTAASGEPCEAPRARRLREAAPWVPPTLADAIVALCAEHPRDRPADARAALARLAAALAEGPAAERPAAASSAPIGRERELGALLEPHAGVRWLEGPPGSGKSHLLRELVTRALLDAREARLVALPVTDGAWLQSLVAVLRGARDAWPFTCPIGSPLLVALDGVDRAPDELAAALEAYRCRAEPIAGLDLVASARAAPALAPRTTLAPLTAAELAALCRELGESETGRIDELVRAAAGSPGWVAAAVLGVPLTRDAALERARSLGAAARALLGAIAIVGGAAPAALCDAVAGAESASALAELHGAGLVTCRAAQDGRLEVLAQASLAAELAEALGDFELGDRLAETLLGPGAWSAELLLRVAGAPRPPARRAELLRRAAARARAESLRSLQIEALLALAADPRERSRDTLLALDRLTRGGGSQGLHPEVVSWLGTAAEADPELRPLLLRRRADQAARAGDAGAARQLAEQALAAGEALGDAASIALGLAAIGAVALYRADWPAAEQALSRAHALAACGAFDDPEERARLDHNLGVVALYRGRLERAVAAFERALAHKRALGDRAGLWPCLLNLGLALGKARRFAEAERALAEAIELARSVGQPAGAAWCLAAAADVAVRRGDAREAERWLAEAAHQGESLPEPVRQDLGLLAAEVALLEGDAASARAALDRLDPGALAADALLESRWLVLCARAALGSVPADRRAAARLAVRAIRRARGAGLPEPEVEARGVLGAARLRPASPARALPEPARYAPGVAEPDAAWSWLARLARGEQPASAGVALAAAVARDCGAERAFVALVGRHDASRVAWGGDLDGLPIAEPERRLPADLVDSALRRATPVYLRDAEGPAGRGSRLALATAPGGDGGRAVIVVEHRFAPGRFDAIEPARLARWATLAGLLGRVAGRLPAASPGSGTAEPRPVAEAESSMALPAQTTSLPLAAARRSFPEILGSSRALAAALARLDAAIDSDLPALIVGETGTGKELFARALHDHGSRARRAFVAVSCAAIPDTLFEAELFGHARGAFTGADRARPGLLAAAEGGTLLLDEIGELPSARQATLLRALETRRSRPVGGDEERGFDVRIVAATHRDLRADVARGRFREDLFYRLAVLEIRVPPLRDRAGDVALLVQGFLARGGARVEIAPEALAVLDAWHWPGNVRELQHQIERLIAAGIRRIEVRHLPRELRAGVREPRAMAHAGALRPAPRAAPDDRAAVLAALDEHDGNITRAAARLGLTRHGLKKRMLRLGLRARAAAAGRSSGGEG